MQTVRNNIAHRIIRRAVFWAAETCLVDAEWHTLI